MMPDACRGLYRQITIKAGGILEKKYVLDEAAVVQQYHELRSCRKVAELYGCSDEHIRRFLKSCGVDLTGWKCEKKKKRQKKIKPQYTDDEIWAAYEKYKVQKKAAEALGVSNATISRVVKRKTESTFTKACEYCGAPINRTYYNARFCSKLCKDLALRKKKGIRCNLNVEPFHKVCKVCGKKYETRREASVTCSSECSRLRRQPTGGKRRKESVFVKIVPEKFGGRFEYVKLYKGRVTLRCSECGELISRTESCVREKNIKCEFCEETKRREEEIANARTRFIRCIASIAEKKTPKECGNCGEIFYSVSPYAKYCSKKCKCSGGKTRERCRKYGGYYDPEVTRIKVIRRDKYICQICGKECDPNDLRWGTLGPDFPTVDHIVALANGGTHTWDNVQCACALCNSYKRDLEDYAAEVS